MKHRKEINVGNSKESKREGGKRPKKRERRRAGKGREGRETERTIPKKKMPMFSMYYWAIT